MLTKFFVWHDYVWNECNSMNAIRYSDFCTHFEKEHIFFVYDANLV